MSVRRQLLGALVPLALGLIALAPAAAGAETRTFVNFDVLFPTGGALTEGPASQYPSTIPVSGLAGTVTGVKLTTVDLGSANGDDIEMALTGPNGATAMLMSDACGAGFSHEYWTFEDAAPVFLSNNGPCAANQHAPVKPSNYLGASPEPDDLSVKGGPVGPYLNNLAALAGGTPNGDWKLWLLDDNGAGYNGFALDTWVLTLEVEPPPPPPPPSPPAPAPAPTIVTVQVPLPVASAPAKTGKRGRALAKCKKKPSKEARKRCRANAKKQPA